MHRMQAVHAHIMTLTCCSATVCYAALQNELYDASKGLQVEVVCVPNASFEAALTEVSSLATC